MQRMSMKIVLPVNKNVKSDQIWEKEYDIDCQIMNLYLRYRDMSMILLLFVTDEYALLGVISISTLKISHPKIKMKVVHVNFK